MPFGRRRTHSPPPNLSPRPTAVSTSDLSPTTSILLNPRDRPSPPDSASSSQPPVRIDTQSSGQSDESSQSGSRLSGLSRLHHAISRGTNPTSHSHSHSHTRSPSSSTSISNAGHSLSLDPVHFPEPSTPLHLAELAIAAILTVPGPPLEVLRAEIFPKLFHEEYSHRANCREHGLKELEQMVARFRRNFETMRVRFRSHIIEQDGSATMQAAAVGLTYDIIATPHHHHEKGEHRRDVEEKRSQVMAVVKIFEGRLAQTDIVLDTAPFQEEHGPQLNQCSIM
ncbi:hypothetical protein JCM10212_006481 [Sporobolomyces blumeae]